MSDPSVIPAAGARAQAAQAGVTVEQLMLDLLPVARAHAVTPISSFAVGAVAQGTSGALYFGANVEFAGRALPDAVHAEQAAVLNAWVHGEAGISALAVTAAPCGSCRQFLNELQDGDRMRVLLRDATPATLASLLPAAFGPRDLGLAGWKLADEHHGFALEPADEPEDWVATAALAAANLSYAPYSRAFSGVALATADGATHEGRYAENAAFNPSLLPLQGALIQLTLAGTPFASIRRAVLVEAAGPVSQRAATEALLRAVAPTVPLIYRRAVPGPRTAATVQESEGLDSTDTSALS